MMFCIGSDISYVQNDNVLTSVEQNLLNGEVIYNDGQEKQLSSNSNMQLKQLKWVYHNNTGYILEEQIMLLYKYVSSRFLERYQCYRRIGAYR